MRVRVIGKGLAGCEACYQLAKRGFSVDFIDMRPNKMTLAHNNDKCAWLVCSNSLRSDNVLNAVGLLKAEMRLLDSIIMQAADYAKLPAGSALAVDRDLFSDYIENKLKSFNNINWICEEYNEIDVNDLVPTIICAGPLASDSLCNSIKNLFQLDNLSFFDAVAPIISSDSINYDIAYFKSRYDKGEGDYLNCPMDREQFEKFYYALINAECVELRDFENDKVFEGCMPIEVMAKRGIKTLTFGPLKPVGLEHNNKRHFAVVQLRQDNVAKTLYNLVGFQTHLTFKSQEKIIKLIPGLENAKIVRYGVMHRNTYIKSPEIINQYYQSKKYRHIYFAGQISGVEGYVESAASGLLAALKLAGGDNFDFPLETMIASMGYYVSHCQSKHFQPMNANFGILMSSLDKKEDKVERSLLLVKDYVARN